MTSCPQPLWPAGTPVPRLAARSVVAWVTFLVPTLVGLGLDLWSKAYAFSHPPVGPQGEPLIPGVLGFKLVVNEGAVFGIAQGKGYLFIMFSFVALGAIGYVFAKSLARQWVLHLALGLITAGAVGNLYDRIVFGSVRDFLHFYVSWYPYVFNVADVLLCIGVPLLMLCWLFPPEPSAAISASEPPR